MNPREFHPIFKKIFKFHFSAFTVQYFHLSVQTIKNEPALVCETKLLKLLDELSDGAKDARRVTNCDGFSSVGLQAIQRLKLYSCSGMGDSKNTF